MNFDIILEGTDAVGKTTTAKILEKYGITVRDRSRECISKYMVFDVDMATRVKKYYDFLQDPSKLVIFLVNLDDKEIMRRVYSRERVSDFDKLADKYNKLYLDTYNYMKERDLTRGRLYLADCTGISLDDQAALVMSIIEDHILRIKQNADENQNRQKNK